MRSRLAIVDTETTGLIAGIHHVWEVAAIVVETDWTFAEYTWLLKPPDMEFADSTALSISKFYERTPSLLSDDGWCDPVEFAHEFSRVTAGTHMICAVTTFDIPRLEDLVRRHGGALACHYHSIDVENIVAGHLGVEPPYSSRELSELLGVAMPDQAERHTALGDARWALRLYEKWHERTVPLRRQREVAPDPAGSGNGTPSDKAAKPEAPQAKGRKRGRASSPAVPETPPTTNGAASVPETEVVEPVVEPAGSATATDPTPETPSSAPPVDGGTQEHSAPSVAPQAPPPAPAPDAAGTAVASPTREQPADAAGGVIAAVVPKAKAAAVESPDPEADYRPRGMPGPEEQLPCENECGNLTELPKRAGLPSQAQLSWTRLSGRILCRACFVEEG